MNYNNCEVHGLRVGIFDVTMGSYWLYHEHKFTHRNCPVRSIYYFIRNGKDYENTRLQSLNYSIFPCLRSLTVHVLCTHRAHTVHSFALSCFILVQSSFANHQQINPTFSYQTWDSVQTKMNYFLKIIHLLNWNNL